MSYFKDRKVRVSDIVVQHKAIGEVNEDKNRRHGIVTNISDSDITVELPDGSSVNWSRGADKNWYSLTARIEAMDNKANKMRNKETRIRNSINSSVDQAV